MSLVDTTKTLSLVILLLFFRSNYKYSFYLYVQFIAFYFLNYLYTTTTSLLAIFFLLRTFHNKEKFIIPSQIVVDFMMVMIYRFKYTTIYICSNIFNAIRISLLNLLI